MRTDVVLVKLGAALIVVTAVGNFQTYIALILGKPWWIPTALISLMFAVVIPLLIALVFWKFPKTVVGSLYTNETDKQHQSIELNDFYVVGVSLLGLYTLVFGIIELVHVETMKFALVRHFTMTNIPATILTPEVDAQRFAGIARVVIGVLLIGGRRGISNLLKGIRTAGRPVT